VFFVVKEKDSFHNMNLLRNSPPVAACLFGRQGGVSWPERKMCAGIGEVSKAEFFLNHREHRGFAMNVFILSGLYG
tara:strand:- start:554 stop:781 length:228 start_codon:yes stop_codon:yes gene_type:complete